MKVLQLVLQIVDTSLQDVAEDPKRLDRAMELAEEEIGHVLNWHWLRLARYEAALQRIVDEADMNGTIIEAGNIARQALE